ncbi:unnamed protein product [Mycena citricolor]|uniref:Tubulin-tyrosine ligase n=2 Tax=Mycena citricolor TaxID=2018698 RepID=A0AAD2JW73_9AGAR|nr:unnamed protein product [Mycena citricolor]
MFQAVVSWPSAPVTKSLVLHALKSLDVSNSIVDEVPEGDGPILFWSTYDDIDHESVHLKRSAVLSSSYTFRKALIRKHFLSRCLHSYTTKHPESPVVQAVPKTFEIEISFADELEELLVDDLWELGKELEAKKWWILKPGMADRGNGIRMFNSVAALEAIFQEFEESDDDEDQADDSTTVVTSQLRHFVIQEYLANPLLFDPAECTLDGSPKPCLDQLRGHKFHLRAYCVASGALQVYLFDKILALFSAVPYSTPVVRSDQDGDPEPLDLSAHLTNTSLQTHRGEDGVRLFRELETCHIMSGSTRPFTAKDMSQIIEQMVVVLRETFKAALENPIHFQPLPNAFELFGVDFMVTDDSEADSRFNVSLLEINAEPAIELTGPRLSWILSDLFDAMAKTCVQPFFDSSKQLDGMSWAVGANRDGLIKCFEQEVRAPE